jgi:CheY-like chemotaxis protein
VGGIHGRQRTQQARAGGSGRGATLPHPYPASLIPLNPPSAPSCLCRRVIEGHLDPAAPTISRKGGFWFNSITRLLAEPSRSGLTPGACRRCLDAGFKSGDFVMLAVSDDGCGMDRETLNNIFEPFFTTKRLGQGTGLGLATVYGIVKQNDGFINVYSEPGEGASFRIYLPRYAGDAVAQRRPMEEAIIAGHGETVLVVEDDPAILKLTARILASLNYTVIEAHSPKEAIAQAEAHTGAIHLLVTDVVMPDMNGRELSNTLTRAYPELRTLFMSGYTADVIAHRGILDSDVHFVPKPFSKQLLAASVRSALNGT